MLTRLFSIGLVLAGLAVGPASAYPERPIRAIVPNAPGGSSDLTTRVFQRALEQLLPQRVAVVNVVGGGTSIGARQVRDAPADGHTVLMIHQAMMTAAATGVADFGPEAFEPVAQTGADPSIVVVGQATAHQTLNDFLAAARNAPNTLRAGVQIGALNHIGMLAVAGAGEARLRYVQTGGGAPSLTSLMGRHIDVTFLTLSDALRYHRNGDVRILAVLEPARLPNIPDIPTARDQGLDVALSIKHIWWMPRGTPQARVDAFADALQQAMASEAVQRHFAETLTSPVFLRGPELRDEIGREYDRIRSLAAEAGIARR
jgi:putative tricarboxylic transport membrane protein